MKSCSSVSLQLRIIAKAPTGEKLENWKQKVRKKALRKRHLGKKKRVSSPTPPVLDPAVPPSDSLIWRGESWKTHRKHLLQFQQQIYSAALLGETALVTNLQTELVQSEAARSLAVRRVAMTHPQRRQAGSDGVHSLSEEQQRALRDSLFLNEQSDAFLFRSVQRAWKETRQSTEDDIELCFCTMKDRAKQVLLAWALEAQLEALFCDYAIFSHRPGRSFDDLVTWLSPHLVTQNCFLSFSVQIADEVRVQEFLSSRVGGNFVGQIKSWCGEGLLRLGLFPTGIGRHAQEQCCPILPSLSNFLSYHILLKVVPPSWIATHSGEFIVVSEKQETLLGIQDQLRCYLEEIGLEMVGGCLGEEIPIGQCEIKKEVVENEEQLQLQMKTGVLEQHLKNLHSAFELSELFYEDKSGLINRLNPLIKSFSTYFSLMDCEDELKRADEKLKELLVEWSFRNNPILTLQEAIHKEFNGSEENGLEFEFKTRIVRLVHYGDSERRPVSNSMPLNQSLYNGQNKDWILKLKKFEFDMHPALLNLL